METALLFLKEVLEHFANEDYLEIDWFSATFRFQENTAGMLIMGDWQNGELKSAGFTNVITSYSIHYTKLYEMPFLPIQQKRKIGNLEYIPRE